MVGFYCELHCIITAVVRLRHTLDDVLKCQTFYATFYGCTILVFFC